MNKLIVVLSYCTLILFFYSCKKIKQPQVVGVENIEVISVNKDSIVLDGVLMLQNDNRFSINLKETDLKVIMWDVEVAEIVQTLNTEMKAKSQFELPIRIKLELTKIYEEDPLAAVTKGLEMFSRKELTIDLIGHIKAGKDIASVIIPVERREVIEW